MSILELREVVARALEEDIGDGDITTQACVAETQIAEGRFFARQDLVLYGVEMLDYIYRERGGVEELQILAPSGSVLSDGDEIAFVRGRARTLLECERVALNFMQRLSGVATLARRYMDAVEGTGVRILDTRKTTPGLRMLEKMAAHAGGVTNHRLGLFDAILIKNNHIAAAGGVRHAIERASGLPHPIEIEVRSRAELDEALACGVRRVLLDNLTPAEAAQEIAHIAGRCEVELSGGIQLGNLREYAEARPDFISCGAITHSATAVDINFRLTLE